MFDYFIEQLNSSKAYAFMSYYHYSGVGFKKAKLNLGVYRRSDNLLVGVLQWGCSAQEGIRLDKYVKEPIEKEQYLELNRFCMADSEPKNAESKAISLCIRWIKKNRPDIRLLVSYAGRKEGNYGYIYQATNWEYLGYFVSDGFWIVNGQEKHQLTLWSYYKRHCEDNSCFKDYIVKTFDYVEQTWTKQFIYIQRLDKELTPASAVLPYPKPSNEYPICTKTNVYKNGEYEKITKNKEMPIFYFDADEDLFTRRALIRQGGAKKQVINIYNLYGQYEGTCDTARNAAVFCGVNEVSVAANLKSGKNCKGWFFRKGNEGDEAPQEINDFDYICEIDGLKFSKQTEVADYCGVSKQSVSQAKQRQSKQINGKEIIWNNN